MNVGWTGRGDSRKWMSRLMRVAERDGWVCYLCGKAVSLMFSVRHNNRATVDHFIPRSSRYGSNRFTNLRVACYKCNSLKGSSTWFAEVS